MRLESFEEWFAIRPNHSDEGECLPGRLSFDLKDGISLESIWFLKNEDTQNGPLVRGQTLTGWLDYQRPATLIKPWVQSIAGLSIGMDTPVLRSRQRLVASALLKNVFLEDISAAIFTELVVEHPAFHAWINPCLVNRDWSRPEGANFLAISVDVQPRRERVFTLADGTQATIISTARASGDETMKLEEYTVLRLQLPAPVDFDAITRLTWRISTLFEFLIGARVQAPVYYLPTKRTWKGEECEVVAEYWYRPVSRKNRQDTPPEKYQRLTLERESPVSLEALLNHITGNSDELIFLADQLQSVEDCDLNITQGYVEILGCLEAFDARTFGSGADKNYKSRMNNLNALVEEYGAEDDKALFKRIAGAASNRFSLLKRLERLHEMWSQDGFREAPDLRHIRDLRNIVPHGRGLEVSSGMAQEMFNYSSYLTALGRYHVLKALGFNGDQIGAAFLSQAHRYGMFIPERLTKSYRKSDDNAKTDD